MVGFRFFYGSELFYALGWLVWLTVVSGLGFFCVSRYCAVRVYLRVSYVFLGFRFFVGFRVVLRLGLVSFYYGWVGLRVF